MSVMESDSLSVEIGIGPDALNAHKTESASLPKGGCRIYLETDMLQEDLQDRQRYLLQLIHKMTVIRNPLATKSYRAPNMS